MNTLAIASSAARLYPSYTYPYPLYYQPQNVVDSRVLILQPILTPRQGMIGNLVNAIGGILNQGSQDGQINNQRPSGDGNGVTPEDVQAIWISGFPIRRTIPRTIPTVWQAYH